MARACPNRPGPQIFILRCWYEELGGGRGEWRGEVRHAGTERCAYFRQMDKLVAFLEAVLAQAR